MSQQQAEYDDLVNEVNGLIPEANPDNEEVFDQGFVIETMELAEGLEAKGYTPAAALEKALNYTRPGWREPAPDPAPAPSAPEPRKTDVAKNLETAEKTPPRMDEGDNSDTGGIQGKLDITKLSDAEFEKLTEEQLAQLRGDNI